MLVHSIFASGGLLVHIDQVMLGHLILVLWSSAKSLFFLQIILIFASPWGCFGFDSIRHWTVSTPGVGSLPVNLSFQTISWQQLLRTRCLVCKAH